MTNKKFPQDFLFGVSTSSHQVEGNCDNDWTDWEKSQAVRLAGKAQKNLKFWGDEFMDSYKSENYLSGRACDHWNLFEKDIYLISKLGLGAYRFSVEWSKVEPEEGKFDQEALNHYKNLVKVLRTYKIEPFVTLWHWTLPKWLKSVGGFQSKKSVEYFTRFAEKVAETLKDNVKYIIVLNEPEVYSLNSYWRGIWPPQKKNPFVFLRVLRNLITAYKKTYQALKKINSGFQIGIAKNNTYFEAYKSKVFNKLLKRSADYLWNDYFLNQIKDRQDFIGLNYYFHSRINGWFDKNENRVVSDLGWELHPEGIYHVLKDLKKFNRPIYILENGLADAKDKWRSWFIEETLNWIGKAMEENLEVKGYFYWSLIDNFEWDKGFWPRFGLFEVDYETLERIPRKSAFFYADLISKLKE